jgi:hypothetical protein
MLDPDLVLASVITSLQSINDVVREVGGDVNNIYAHQYLYGVDNSLTRAIEQQPAGTVMVAYLDLLEGSISGYGRWKHRLEIFIRPNNAAEGGNVAQTHSSPLHIAWMLMNNPLTVPSAFNQNFRTASLLPELLPCDTPTIQGQTDSQEQDYFKILVSIPEQGDS